MVRLVLKIVLFAVLFFIGLTFTDDYFKERRISYLDREIYEELDTNVDIAIFGSSHGMNGVDPRFLQKELRKTTYNFSSAGQRLVTTIPVIDEILADNELELAIVDIFPGTVASIRRTEIKTRAFQYNTFDNIDFSWSKVIAHTRVNGIESFLQMSPTIRRHHHWVDIFGNPPQTYDARSDFNHGYFSRFYFDQRIWDQKIANVMKNEDRDKPILSLTKGEKKNIDAVVSRFRRSNIPVLFVSVPYYQDTMGIRTSTHQTLIMQYLEEIKVPVIDFNLLWDELEFTQDEFTDAGHANTKAALKISQYLAGYVRKHYKFDEDTISKGDLLSNRYAIMDNEDLDVLFKMKPDSSNVLYAKGIRQMYMFNAYANKYEVLLECKGNLVKPFSIRYEFALDAKENDELDKKLGKYVNHNGVFGQRVDAIHELNYGGKSYRLFQFETQFDTLDNFKLIYIEGQTRKEILQIDKLSLR